MSYSQEKILLLLAGIFVATNQIGWLIAADRSPFDFYPVLIWIACAIVGVRVLNRLLPQRDMLIFPATMFLVGWGGNLVGRLLPAYTVRQSAWLVIGVAALLTICTLPSHLHWLRRFRYTWLLSGLGLLAITILIGVNPSGSGARLWLGLLGVFFQPSELLKILLVVFLASYLADHQSLFRSGTLHLQRQWQFIGPVVLMWSICVVLLIWQRDLGAATIFYLVFLFMLYVATGRLWLLMAGSGLLTAVMGGAYFFLDIVASRVDIWLSPWRDPADTTFQIVQSLMAVADGGLFGAGIGGGIPTFIPVVHSDFAYAAIVEEWGLIGAIGVMSGLLVIIMRGLRLAVVLQHKPFHAYLAVGICLMLSVQSLLIMGGVVNMLPLTGVTLPFVSYGGSSLLVSFISVGILLLVSNDVERQNHDVTPA